MSIFRFRKKVYRPTHLLQQLEERIVLDAAVAHHVKNDSALDHIKDSVATPGAFSHPVHGAGAEAASMPTKLDHVFSHHLNTVLVPKDIGSLDNVLSAAKDNNATNTQSSVVTDTTQTSTGQTLSSSTATASGTDVLAKTDPSTSSTSSITSSSVATTTTDVSPTVTATATTSSTTTKAAYVDPTYYVDNVAGSDSNDGLSPTTAWKTLDKVMNTLTGDDSYVNVLFKRGETWNGEFDIPGSGSPGYPFVIGAYGTGANPIINAGTTYACGIAAYNANHDVIINGVDVYGGTDSGMIFYDPGVHDITIENLTVSHSAHTGIYVGVPNVTIQNVTVDYNGTTNQDHGIYFGVGASGVAQNGVVNGVVAHDNYGFGVQLWDASSGVVENSLIYSNGKSSGGGGGIALGTDGTTVQNLSVHDNLIYNNLQGVYLEGLQKGSSATIYNDTLYGNTNGGILDASGSSGSMINIKNNIFSSDGSAEIQIHSPASSDYNVFYHPSSGTTINWQGTNYTSAQWSTYKSASGQDAHSIYGNPNFTNPTGSDFTLASTSPAIDKGSNLGSAYQDGLSPTSSWPSSVTTVNENSYGSGWEIGAYAYTTATTINHAPAGTDKVVTMLEDGSYVVTAADFGFTDPLDNPANNFTGVKITQLETAGSLKLNGVDVTLNQVITKANIDAGILTFTPAANSYGTAYANFKFAVMDDGGTANGGVNIDQSPNTFTFDVLDPSHAPAGTNKTVTILEDHSYVVTSANFGFTDPLDSPANNFTGVKITQLETAGSLKLNGVDVTLNQVISKTDIDAGHLVFTPAANANGTGYANFKFAVMDDGSTANGGINIDQTPKAFTFNVTSVNDAPVGTNNTVTMSENTAYTVKSADFGFSDPNDNPSNSLNGVKITQLPTAGTLKLNGVNVTLNQIISKANIDSGLLKFTPAANAYGAGYATFKFAVRDNGGTANGGVNIDQSPKTFTFDVASVVSVASVNHAPAGTDKVVTMLEDGTYVVQSSDFGFTDPNDSPANNFTGVTITQLPTAGTLKLNGVNVTLNQVISKANIDSGLLTFTPAANANGTAYSNFKFAVMDDGSTANGGVNTDQTPNAFTFNVTSVNDAPVGTNKTVTMNENTTYAVTSGDFGFTDPNDNPANNLASVKITQLESAGSLKLNGVDVTLNQIITKANIDAGLLTFTPAANAYGTGYATFKFAVMDDGGTANGGINTDQSPKTFTFNVTDPPPPTGKVYYVDSVAGSDSNSGTSATSPWNSLAKVMNTLTGDQSDVTVLFKRGDTWNGELDIPGSGTTGHPFTLGAYGTGADPVINAGTTYATGIAAYNLNHDVVINGIDVYGGTDSGMCFYDNGIHDITIENLTVSHSAHTGIYVGVANVTIEDVTTHDNGSSTQDHGVYFGVGSSGYATNGLVDGLVSYNNRGFGIQMWDANSGEIKNSIIYSNGASGAGGGMALGTDFTNIQNLSVHDNVIYNNNNSGIYLQTYQSGSNFTIYNNTIYGNKVGGAIQDAGGSSGAKISLKNNIFSSDSGSAELYITTPAAFTSDYNLFYDPNGIPLISWHGTNYSSSQFATYKSATGQDAHSIYGNPNFTNPGAGNFTLLSTSPAINAGYNLGSYYEYGLSPTSSWPSGVSNVDENAYGSWEIGAYVYMG